MSTWLEETLIISNLLSLFKSNKVKTWPEIDGMVLIPDILEPDQMVIVEITEALEYDLVAKVVVEL